GVCRGAVFAAAPRSTVGGPACRGTARESPPRTAHPRNLACEDMNAAQAGPTCVKTPTGLLRACQKKPPTGGWLIRPERDRRPQPCGAIRDRVRDRALARALPATRRSHARVPVRDVAGVLPRGRESVRMRCLHNPAKRVPYSDLSHHSVDARCVPWPVIDLRCL